ncbi:MAG: hypothetical protein K2P48_09030 [Lachnospiraceae bacterium]|nr:hypothetical protein [Lachnospiraceae bacterium]
MTDQEKKQNKNVYREETSQIHAPVDLILRTKQAVAEEEERLHKEMGQAGQRQESERNQGKELRQDLRQISPADLNGTGMVGAESDGKKMESKWEKYYRRVPRLVLPVTAAAVFVLVLRVSVVQFSYLFADRRGGADYAASAEDMSGSAGEEGFMEGMSGSAGDAGLAGGMSGSADEDGLAGGVSESADGDGLAGGIAGSTGERCSASGRPGNTDGESLREGELLEDLEREEETASSADMAEARKQSKSEDMQQAPYARAYLEFLTEYVQNSKDGKGQGARFSLAFVDDDDIPELLLMEDDCHAEGVKVFTYYQDQVVELGAFGSSGLMQYVERAGLIFSHYMGHGESDNDFFEIKEGQAVLICNMHSTPYRKNGIDANLYEIDGVAVNEKTYRARWKALYEDQDYVLIGYKDGTPVEEAAESELLRQ